MLICGTELTLYDIFPELICFVSFLPVIVVGTNELTSWKQKIITSQVCIERQLYQHPFTKTHNEDVTEYFIVRNIL